MRVKRPSAGVLLLLAAAACWGSATTLGDYAVRELDAIDVLFIELLTGGAVLWTLTVVRLRTEVSTRRWRSYLLLGVFEPGLTYLLANEGLAEESASTASLLLSLETVFAVLLAVAVLRERLDRATVLAVSFGLVGILVVAAGAQPGRDSVRGSALILAASVTAAFYGVLARRSAGHDRALIVTSYQVLAAFGLALPFVIATHATSGSLLPQAGADHVVAAVAAGLTGVALPFLLFNKGIVTVRASTAAVLINAIPVFGVITAIVALGERPTLQAMFGGILILAGVTWVGLSGQRRAAGDRIGHPSLPAVSKNQPPATAPDVDVQSRPAA